MLQLFVDNIEPFAIEPKVLKMRPVVRRTDLAYMGPDDHGGSFLPILCDLIAA
jgi:hypothetical protein